jgi:hypothetical protein
MLDDIVYGNPSQRDLLYLEKESSFDKFIPQLIKFGFPSNSSKATREELNTLVDYVTSLKAENPVFERYRSYDVDLEKVFAEILIKRQLSQKCIDAVDQIFDDSLPFLLKLKYHFQRPRPYQLAKYYKLNLFPYNSFSADTPSYPSGHTFQALLICNVLGNYNPEMFDYFDKLVKDIQYSRLYLGVHYQSDNDFSVFCAETILKSKEFKAKYGI